MGSSGLVGEVMLEMVDFLQTLAQRGTLYQIWMLALLVPGKDSKLEGVLHVVFPGFAYDGKDAHIIFTKLNLTGPEVLAMYHEKVLIPWMVRLRKSRTGGDVAIMWYSHDGDSATNKWVEDNLHKMTALFIRVCFAAGPLPLFSSLFVVF